MSRVQGSALASPPAETHKRSKISKTEWRNLFTTSEKVRSDWVENNIETDLSSLSGISLDAQATAVLGAMQVTYRILLRTAYKSFTLADWININDPETQLAIQVMSVTGVLDNESRVAVLLQGIPIVNP